MTTDLGCRALAEGPLTAQESLKMARLFKVLSDPARLQLLSCVASQPPGGASVSHLARGLRLSQPTVSHHLKLLHDAGLLSRERRSTSVYYELLPNSLRALQLALACPEKKAAETGSSSIREGTTPFPDPVERTVTS